MKYKQTFAYLLTTSALGLMSAPQSAWAQNTAAVSEVSWKWYGR